MFDGGHRMNAGDHVDQQLVGLTNHLLGFVFDALEGVVPLFTIPRSGLVGPGQDPGIPIAYVEFGMDDAAPGGS